MHHIDTLIELLNKIFPNESCTIENVAAYARRLALKKVNRSNEQFVDVQPQETTEGGQYTAQRIAPNAARSPKKSEPYATFRRMKKIGGRGESYWSYYSDDVETFCKQAAFMKNFTDTYDQKIPIDAYHATYEKMDDAQLRTYFTWRTRVRQGIVEETSFSYVLCYIFELINDVGVTSPADAMEKLLAIWVAYRAYDTRLDDSLCDWLRDYYVVHHTALTSAFAEYRRRFPPPFSGEDLALAQAKTCSWDNLRDLELSSSFKITNGQFYKAGDQQMIEKCACFVMQALVTHLKGGGVDFRNLVFEKRREKCPSLFRNAVHPAVTMQPVVVPLDEFERMKLGRGGWYREYVSATRYRPVLGYILKCMEVQMRQHFGYKRKLQLPQISVVENCFLNSEPEKFRWPNHPTMDRLKVWKGRAYDVISSAAFLEVLAKAISDYCALEHLVVRAGTIQVVQPVEIDFSRLKDIERDYIATAAKLIIEEPLPAAKVPSFQPVAAPVEAGGMAGLVTSLSSEGRALLGLLLAEGQAPSNGELIIEAINEQALEAISDNLIDYADGVPYVYEEYRDELKSSLGGQ